MRRARPVAGDIASVPGLNIYLLGTQPIAGPSEEEIARFACDAVAVGPFAARPEDEPELGPVLSGTAELLVTNERVVVVLADGTSALGPTSDEECVVFALPWIVVDTISVSTKGGRRGRREGGPVSVMNVGDPGFMLEIDPKTTRSLPRDPSPDVDVTPADVMTALVRAGATNRKRFHADTDPEQQRLTDVLDHEWLVQGDEVVAWLRQPPHGAEPPVVVAEPTTVEERERALVRDYTPTTLESLAAAKEASVRRIRRAAWIAVGALVLLSFGGFVVNLLTSDERAKEAANTGTSTTILRATTIPQSTTALPSMPDLNRFGPAGTALDVAVTSSRAYTYHALYAVTGAGVAEGVTRSIETWRRPGQQRLDVVDDGPNGTQRSTSISTGSSSRSCTSLNGVVTCQTADNGPADIPELFVQRLLAAGPNATLEATDVVIGGGPARCYFSPAVGEVCLTDEGALLRSDLDGVHLEVAKADFDVFESDFNVTDTNQR